jgi:hypothetical protein
MPESPALTTPLTLQTLPTEIHLIIFDHLHVITSTCLSLTCKDFYDIHFNLHGKVALDLSDTRFAFPPDGVPLTTLLEGWMLPRYTHRIFLQAHLAPALWKFITKDQLEAGGGLNSKAFWWDIAKRWIV